MKELLKQIPTEHYDTLKTLIKHLLDVVKLSALNRMHLQNMALVFGPTLLRIDPMNSLVNNNINSANHSGFNENITLQNDLIHYILYYYNDLFNCNQQPEMLNSNSSIGASAICAADLSKISSSMTMATSSTNLK